MPIFIGDWDKQDDSPIVRIYAISVDHATQTVVAMVNKKLVFGIPAKQIVWHHWANG